MLVSPTVLESNRELSPGSFLSGAPTFAQAVTECGATAQPWFGSFDGDHVRDWSDPIPLYVEVMQNAAGTLRVTTDVDGTVYSTSNGAITLNRLSWSISYPEGSFVQPRVIHPA